MKGLSSATMKRLEKYHWPGNVRELQHAIERALIMSDTKVLQPSDFLFPAQDTKGDALTFDSYNLEEIEKLIIHKAVSKHRGNVTHAAKELGLSRASLYRRMEKYGL